MARTKTYRVKDNRILFKCGNCGTKRSISIPPNLRSKTVRCHRCGVLDRCALNRRAYRREQQRGKAIMTLSDGKEIYVDLHDMSPLGIGVTVAPGQGRHLRLRSEVKIRCSWNPRIFMRGRYVIKSINGDRVGLQNMAQGLIF